ncbi:MAG: LysM peptidoglycan-binding domain-containing protein [Deltaproteobacteria bacterium]|nr:LysM peptidoglycan-binding domain-containing protein [Deltaproteobacteria bacterium]
MKRTTLAFTLVAALGTLAAHDAHAFPHVVRKGETLASIAKAVYGRPDLEHVLVGANALDAQGGSAIAPGMRLEIPAVSHQRAALGDTWIALADRFLGDPRHAAVLAEANGSHPWLPPDPGMVIVVPYVLRHFAAADETIFDLAERYLGDKMLAWQLVVFNDLRKNDIKRGDVVLIPLKNLPLTPAGEAEAAGDAGALGLAAGRILERQRAIEEQLPALQRSVVEGRWIDAVAHGNRLLGTGDFTRREQPLDPRREQPGDLTRREQPGDPARREQPGDLTRSQLARIGKLLATAYVALDATGAAIEACKLYLDNAHTVHLEAATTSPKLRAVCVKH